MAVVTMGDFIPLNGAGLALKPVGDVDFVLLVVVAEG